MSQQGGWYLVEALKAEGVAHLFTLSSGSINPIYNACVEGPVRLIDTRNEQTAAFMADAWGRLTRRPGVCLVTLGPGHLNSLMGLAHAYVARTPMVLISADSDLRDRHRHAFQEIDQVAVVKPITKWAAQVSAADRIPEYLHHAMREAVTGIPGPVHLSIPRDLLKADVSIDYRPPAGAGRWRSLASTPWRDEGELDGAIGLLYEAKRPVILVGSEVWWTEAEEELLRFAEATNVPVFVKDDERGCIPRQHPLYFGVGNPPNNGAAVHIGEADVVALFGLRVDFRSNFGKPPFFSPQARLIQVTADSSDIGLNLIPDVAIQGSVRAVLLELTERAGAHGRWDAGEWLQTLRRTKARFEAAMAELADSGQTPMHPLRLCRAVQEVLGEGDCLVSDGGDIGQWVKIGLLNQWHPPHWLTIGPFLGIGCGVGYALAARLARPQSKVVLVSGDGSLGYGLMDFETAVRFDLPFVCVVSNDAAWGLIKHQQIAEYGRDRVIGTDLPFTRYDLVAESLGAYGALVEDPRHLKEALVEAIASDRPACVNVRVRQTSAVY